MPIILCRYDFISIGLFHVLSVTHYQTTFQHVFREILIPTRKSNDAYGKVRINGHVNVWDPKSRVSWSIKKSSTHIYHLWKFISLLLQRYFDLSNHLVKKILLLDNTPIFICKKKKKRAGETGILAEKQYGKLIFSSQYEFMIRMDIESRWDWNQVDEMLII